MRDAVDTGLCVRVGIFLLYAAMLSIVLWNRTSTWQESAVWDIHAFHLSSWGSAAVELHYLQVPSC